MSGHTDITKAVEIERLIFKHVRVHELFDGAIEFVGVSAAADAILAVSESSHADLVKALEEIRDHWANQYDHPRKDNEMYRGSYGIGVTDGHRACAIIATAALATLTARKVG